MKAINVTSIWGAVSKFIFEHMKKLTAETLGWLAVIVLHCSIVPSLLAVMAGLSDRTPPLDIVMFIWAGLVLLFARAIVLKDQLNMVTISVGFIAQAVMLSFILLK